MKNENISAVILCGGQSRRMGQDKAGLRIGEQTFLERIVRQFKSENEEEEILLSVRDEQDYPKMKIRHVADLKKDMGPLMGIYSAIKAAQNEKIWVMSCDMPFIDREVAETLFPYLTDGIDAVIPVDRDGRKYVLCAWYRRSVEHMIKEQLDAGNYKVQDLLNRLRICYVAVEGIPDGERKFRNVNTPREYQKLQEVYGRGMPEREISERKMQDIPVFSFVAYSGTGKTTFLEKLIPALKDRGLKIAIVKHDGHRFEIDHEGKDSDRFTKAGADVTGLISSEKAVLMENRGVSPEQFLAKIEGVDLILTEGFKKEKWPKIMLHRKGTGKPMPLEPRECLAVITDDEVEGCDRIFSPEDIEAVADFLINWTKKADKR